MIKNQTWVALVVLALMAGFVFYLNREAAKKDEVGAEPTAEVGLLFGPEEGVVSSLKIESSFGDSVEIKLGADGKWMLSVPAGEGQAPIEGEAEPSQVGAAASSITSLRNLGSVEADLEILELDEPPYTMTIGFSGGKTHKLSIGSITPSQNGYYAQLDDDSVFIIGKDGFDALVPLVFTPPWLTTPTPSPIPPTPTFTPVPATNTPEVTPTP